MIKCWGDGDFGQDDTLGGVFRALSAGGVVSCRLTWCSAAEEPAWLRDPPPALPRTGTGGLLGTRRGGAAGGRVFRRSALRCFLCSYWRCCGGAVGARDGWPSHGRCLVSNVQRTCLGLFYWWQTRV